MRWCHCGHSDTSHADPAGLVRDAFDGPCRSLVSNLAGQTNTCPCPQFTAVTAGGS